MILRIVRSSLLSPWKSKTKQRMVLEKWSIFQGFQKILPIRSLFGQTGLFFWNFLCFPVCGMFFFGGTHSGPGQIVGSSGSFSGGGSRPHSRASLEPRASVGNGQLPYHWYSYLHLVDFLWVFM